MASTSDKHTNKIPADKPAEVKHELTGGALQEQLKVGKILFAVALAPLIMQVCFNDLLAAFAMFVFLCWVGRCPKSPSSVFMSHSYLCSFIQAQWSRGVLASKQVVELHSV